ncbi:hypothetical protein [Brevibacillus halotolerans]|uniref:hypothetical protein n=1 Tax=Brevibacillus halotolerans TaxID=1507437 RepID=UPI0015EEED3E|nr:hypothetical protein [Brevibacillus halotolerans]MBA4533800.1 hypothetical protein [Brevibacillus halotolerans]
MKKFKPYISLIITLTLLVMITPAINVFSNNKAPIVQWLSINESKNPVVYVMPGQISYNLQLESYSQSKKALATLILTNRQTGSQTIIYEDQWLENNSNSGVIELEKGTYEIVLTAKDEDGKTSSPYKVTIVAGSVPNLILHVESDTLLIKKEGEFKDIKALILNDLNEELNTVLQWKWEDEKQWKRQIVKISPAGKTVIPIPVVIQMNNRMERNIEIELNPDKSPPETNYGDNRKKILVQYELPDLEIGRAILLDKTSADISVMYPVKQRNLLGATEPINTSLEYGKGNRESKVGEVKNIILGVGEEKFITVDMPITKVVYGHLNPHQVSPRKEFYGFDNNLDISHFDFTNDINLYVKAIQDGTYRQGESVTTLVTVGNIKDSVQPEPVDLILKFNGREIGRESIHVNPGEEVKIPFTWKTPVTGATVLKTYKLEAILHPPKHKFEEITFDDNYQSTKVVIFPEQINGSTCAVKPTVTSAVSGTYEYWCNCTPAGCSICTGKYYESINIQSKYKPAFVKAGMGFEYNMETEYTNSNPHISKSNDFTKIVSEFDKKGNGEKVILPNVDLFPEKPAPNLRNKWIFPRAKITRGQGDIEMIDYIATRDPLRLEETQFVDGKNRYFTSFYQQDGTYPFAVYGNGAGTDVISHTDIEGKTTYSFVTRRLSICRDESYIILGSPHDDYIYRRVDPNLPYPRGINSSWDWYGFESIFDEIAPWYNHYGKEFGNAVDVQGFTIQK